MSLLTNTSSSRNIIETVKSTLLPTMTLTRRVERKAQKAEEKRQCKERKVCNCQPTPPVWKTRVLWSISVVVLAFFVPSLFVRKRSADDENSYHVRALHA
jgi:hypothetical protein